MRTIFVTIGLPASGKSYWAKEQLKREPGRWKRFNKDDLRSMVDDGLFSKENEELVNKMQENLVRIAINDGFDVILDNTHLVQFTKNKIHKLAEQIGDVTVMEKIFPTPINVCIERNVTRTGSARVPDHVIPGMAQKAGIERNGYKNFKDSQTYYKPTLASVPGQMIEQDSALPKAILCDLDGTLALIGKRSPYDASRCDELDLPNVAVIECVKAMYEQGVKIVFMSGREDKYRPQTIRFIERYVQVDEYSTRTASNAHLHRDGSTVTIPHELHMRSSGDQRKDSIVKQELFDANVRGKYHVLFVLDDRNQVVDFWRSIGLACFQVNPGAF